MLRSALALLLVLLSSLTAHGATITSASPQGEVAKVRQVTIKFSAAVVPFGDLRQPDPFGLQCNGAAPAGSGRWVNDRVWVYDFRADVPPGTQCTLKARPEWKPLDGALKGRSEFAFSTGGPSVAEVDPGEGSEIEEDQNFLLQLSGPAVPASVTANAWCEVEGIGERIALRIVDGAPRDAVLKERRLPKDVAARSLLVACARPLAPEAALRLHWGRGIAAAANPKVVSREEQKFAFTVRKAFNAEFSCERERANSPCLPIRPMSLRFSAPIDRALAAQVRLQPPSGEALKPVFDKDDKSPQLSEIFFRAPLPENASFTLTIPAGIQDDAGRPLANASLFPMKVATGDAPPIAKFAAAPFGIVELDGDAMLPLTLRHVQGDLRAGAASGSVRMLRVDSDIDMLRWYAKLQRFHEQSMTAEEAGLPESEWTVIETDKDGKGRTIQRKVERMVESRTVPVLAKEGAAKRLDLPALQGGDPRPFEVVGIPMAAPGYHVVEIESARLGQSLLDRKAPMYVRTGVLVTNLGVHFKLGRENSLVWVTTLDKGQPVEGADVVVNDCEGQPMWHGRTDAQGLAPVAQALEVRRRMSCLAGDGLFVTARKANSQGVTDTAFVFSNWQKGIEAWRFNQPMSYGPEPEVRAHTVFDRTLLRAGETVSMKHFLRAETSAGLVPLAADRLPTTMRIVHVGSGDEFTQPLQWKGARSTAADWVIPRDAKLGAYEVQLVGEDEEGDHRRKTSWTSGSFRVEEFRLPLVDARISGPKPLQVSPAELPIEVQLNYFSGGGMGQAPARISALLKPRTLSFPAFDEFSFEPPRDVSAAQPSGEDESPASEDNGKLVADKLPLVTDRNGAATVTVKPLPAITRASELTAELSFNDPNGEVQTASSRIGLWPSAVVVGIKAGSWASNRGKVKFTAVALDTQGVPMKGQSVSVKGRLTQTISTRKRMVGGFYAYDNHDDVTELGSLCSGSTDERGLLLCEASLDAAGQVELIAEAKDSGGHAAQAATSVWVTKQGELWFSQSNDDRMDVLPEKKHYEPGETARLQVRMPFREATALVTVEREGVMQSHVVTLRGDDPTLDVKMEKGWGPNVYVSVLALRGRLRDVPWYSFFTWGWKEPLNWVRSFWYEGREYQAPTAMVDLSKPAFKLGVAALDVGTAAHELQVSVTADKAAYAVRQKAVARIKVMQGGQPAAGAEVAFAAVDEGLLALKANDSWDLLHAMIQRRGWAVETSTAQSEIIGRRHYGRKAVAAGGGGGHSNTRELFDTLLLWKAGVTLDANGEATVEVPLNDSLTSFRLVAIADAGVQQFGTGSASIKVTQDLQLLSGLPPLVREGDRFSAMLTLRNTTAHAMKVQASLQGTANDAAHTPLTLPAQDVALAAGAAQEITWPIDVPADATSITWQASADETGGAAKDRLKLTQAIGTAVPLRVLQATLEQVDGTFGMPVAAPNDALPASGPKRGGLAIGLQPKLTGELPGIRRYFETYPFICLEQKVSKSVGLKDEAMWNGVANALPTYLDKDGLANYFPPREGDEARGSDGLTAYLLAATNEAGFELPEASRERMLDGLAAFVEGRIERRFWSPKKDLDERKIAAVEALSRYGRAQPAMLGSINLVPNLWPTGSVIDWLGVLRRLQGVPDQARRIDEAEQILRSRLTYAGTTLKFSTEDSDFWWWLMDSADANAARLILAVLDDPAWKDELPRMVVGALGRQRGGAWLTTTANLWGSLALDKFAKKFESVPIAGKTLAAAGAASAAFDWTGHADGGAMKLPWPDQAATLSVTQEGTGKPWLTVQSLAAIPLKAPLRAGYDITRTVTAVEQKDKSRWSRGDILRVHLEIDAQSDMTWVVVSDPVPGGATVLGSGLGRDSTIATQTEKREGSAWAAYEERSFEAFRSYYGYMPKGRQVIEYTLRLNNPGRFNLPPTRVEAMYAPETFGELPNAAVEVAP